MSDIRRKIHCLKHKEGCYTITAYKDFPIVCVHSQKAIRAGSKRDVFKFRQICAARNIRMLRRDRQLAWQDLADTSAVATVVNSIVKAEMDRWLDSQVQWAKKIA